ncbi:MAG TPA: NAD(P)-binding domain-containing protein [Nannocystaceae bacterium]|nr:NAD(P)-binding domain-containing protein [Nannocystaceae bacterium]
MIAILGTGLLGSGFARAACRRGEAVQVWNRTSAKAEALAEEGAIVFEDPADAARDVTRVHVVLSDDAAVDAVLEDAELMAPATVYDHTTTSTEGALVRTARWAAHGIKYLHAPVFMGPQNALESTGLMLVSGDRNVVEAAKPVLAPMTGKVVDLGTRVDAAAAFKLLGNTLLMAITAGFTDMLALAKAVGVAPAEVAKLFEHFNPGVTLAARFQRMLEAAHGQPSWELAMARKDARLMLEEAGRSEFALAILPAIAARMDALIAAGEGHADWTVLAREFLG